MLKDIEFKLGVYYVPGTDIPFLEHGAEVITHVVNGNDVTLTKKREFQYYTAVRSYEITSSRPEDILEFYYGIIKEIDKETASIDLCIDHQGNAVWMRDNGDINLYLMKAEQGEEIAYACIDDRTGIELTNIEEYGTHYSASVNIDEKHVASDTQCCFRVPVSKAKDCVWFVEFILGLLVVNKPDNARLSHKTNNLRQLQYDIIASKTKPSNLQPI